MKPEISVAMPAYNAERFIDASLTSLLGQKGLIEVGCEIILVNDGSRDQTAARLAAWEKRINRKEQLRVIEQDNQGVAKAVNRGLEQARGKYVVLVDADDLLAQRALAQLHDQIKKTSSALVVGQHLGFDSETGKFLFRTDKENFKVKGNNPLEEPLLRAFGLGHPKITRRTDLEKIGGFDPETGFASDYDFVLKLLFPGEIKQWDLVDKILYFYRVYSSSSVCHRAEQLRGAERALNATLGRLGITGQARFAGRNELGLLSYTF